MRPFILRPLGALSAITCAWLLSQSPAARANDLIERFAAVPTVWDAQVSLDGKHVALGCARDEAPAVCVYELDNASKPPVVLLAPAEHQLQRFTWLDHGWLLMRVQKPAHDRARHRWVGRINDLATNIHTQKISSLGALEVASIPGEPPGEVVFRAGGVGGNVVRIDLASGEVKHNEPFGRWGHKRFTFHVWFNGRGERVLELRIDQNQEQLFVVRGAAETEVVLDVIPDKTWTQEPVVLGVTAGGDRLATLGYYGGDRLQFQLFDAATGKRLPRDAALAGLHIHAGITDVNSDEVVALTYVDELPRQKFLDEKLDRIHATVAKALPGQNIQVLSWSLDRSMATVSATSAGKPPTFYLFDRKQGSLSPLGSAELAGLPATRTTAIEYTARDGLKIEAFLTVPADKQAAKGPLPLILMPHDGPYGRDDAGYHWWVEYFAQRGYAVMRPNYRGSSGYGRAFTEKGHGEFGGAIIDDIIDGARAVIASGLVDRDRVCATGVGYGGYAALMAGMRQPSLIKCVIAVNAVSDAVTVLGDVRKYYSTGSPTFEFWENYLGGRFHDDAAAARISPARSAADLRTPVLLLHDSRTNGSQVTQSRHLKEQMDLYERNAELVEFDAGDPDLVTPTSRRVILTQSDAFLTRHIGAPAAE